MSHKFPYEWKLSEANFTKDKGKVFSCFACGGGSTMGYKLAGFDVLGCNEIDPKMMEVYIENHKPKYSFLESITTFKLREDLPTELYELDILDGSPPCSSFSMAGSREDGWGKEKKFREGQAKQVLDNLFFDFIDLAKKLYPKVLIAENVSGLMMGAAKEYVRKIYIAFKDAGYQLRVAPYLLDASKMGVPQRRQRVFFIALRNDLASPFMEQLDMFQFAPKLKLEFNEPEIPFKIIDSNIVEKDINRFSPMLNKYWDIWMPGNGYNSVNDNNVGFGYIKADPEKVIRTILAHPESGTYHHKYKRQLNNIEYKLAGSYPLDYNFCNQKEKYLIGMSVPPVMIAQIASQVYEQWLSKIN